MCDHSRTVQRVAAAETRIAPRSSLPAWRPRRYLLCRPTFYEVRYRLNPWMQPGTTDPVAALAEWRRLIDIYRDLGHHVSVLDGEPDLPDMVFAANSALVLDGVAYLARFRHEEREGEVQHYRSWLENEGFRIAPARCVQEGEGDFVPVAGVVLAGFGFRTEADAHREAAALMGRTFVSLRLIDPRWYHLDTALFAIDDANIAYYPGAFDDASRERLEALFPEAVIADEADAEAFGLNAVSDGRNVLLPSAAWRLASQLYERGLHPVSVDLPQLLRAGGAIKCCTLELRGRPD